MTDKEKKAIEEQYKEGLVNLSNVIEPLINQFKIDYSLDIQQCRLIINYLLMERDFDENYYEELEKEVQELKEKEKNLLIQLKDSEKELLEVCKKLRNSVSKDKIKAKIEECEKRQEDLRQMPDSVAKSLGIEDCQEKIILYKELLEKE